MNAASRDINQCNFFHGQLVDMRVSRPIRLQIILLVAVFVSALSVVYMTNLHRNTLSQWELAQQEAQQLECEWGQYLLEEASLISSSRIAQWASEKLDMMLPLNKETFVLRAQ